MFGSLQLDVEVVVNVLELEDVDVHWTIACDSILSSVFVDITSIITVEEPEVTHTHLISYSTVYLSNRIFQLLYIF